MDRDSRDDYPETIELVSLEVIELCSSTRYRSGTNDYSSEKIRVIAVIDCKGIRHEGIWEQDWSTLSAGITTRQDNQGQQLRIKRSVCPVRVLYQEFREYVSYDFQSHCQQSTEHYWVKYVLDQETSE